MASASSSYFTLITCALLCMCIQLSTGAFLLRPSKQSNSSESGSNPSATKSSTPPPSPPGKSPTPPPPPPPSPPPSPSPSPPPSPPACMPSPGSVLNLPESAKRKRGRILGLVLVSFVGVLQAFVVLFLFVKRRQMLKHAYGSRDHHDPPHIWANA